MIDSGAYLKIEGKEGGRRERERKSVCVCERERENDINTLYVHITMYPVILEGKKVTPALSVSIVLLPFDGPPSTLRSLVVVTVSPDSSR